MIYNSVYSKFQKYKTPSKDFLSYLKDLLHLEDDTMALEVLQAAGFWFSQKGGMLELETLHRDIKSSTFCFVDIETTGAKPLESQVIEIGAIKYRDGEILEEFQTLVHAHFVPESITELTGIDVEMLESAPKEERCLQDFREFLGDSVFVAHNVAFDYGFISARLELYGSVGLLNPRLCTVELARKSILSLKYSLAYLNEFLGINIADSHRAYFDALACLRVFEIACLSLSEGVVSVQDLIEFSRGKRI